MKKILLIIFILCICLKGIAQVNVQFFPEVDGRNLQGLFNAKLINSDATLLVYVKIEVISNTSRKICEIKTSNFKINKGLNTIPTDAVRNAKYQFSNNSEGKILSKTSIIPNGENNYCYTVVVLDQFITDNIIKPIIDEIENCFEAQILPFSQLSLTAPYDEESICEARPIFSWLPSIPMINGAIYKLICTEIKIAQSGTEALKYNLAFINSSGIQSPILPLPSNIKALEEGKSYAWQVIQYKDDVIINKSEIWTFTVKCGNEDKNNTKVLTNNSFRIIEDLNFGNNYLVSESIKVIINNSGIPQQLKYELFTIENDKDGLKNLPDIQIITGENKVVIPLKNVKGLKNNTTYLLRLYLSEGVIKELRIVYQKDEK